MFETTRCDVCFQEITKCYAYLWDEDKVVICLDCGFGKDIMFLHFTDEDGAKAICQSKRLKQSSYVEAIYAVKVGGAYVPSVQRGELGAAKNRDYAVLFNTKETPAYWHPEETVWHGESITLEQTLIITAEEAITLLEEGVNNE